MMIGRATLLDQLRTLSDAELVLLVDDDQAEVMHQRVVVQQRVRADQDVGFFVGRGAEEFHARAVVLLGAGHQRDAQTERLQPLAGVARVLLGEDLRGGHERGLRAGLDGGEHRGKRDDGFAQTVLEIILKHAPDYDAATMEMRPSKNGNFLSVTATINAQSKTQIDDIYRALTSHPLVLMAL